MGISERERISPRPRQRQERPRPNYQGKIVRRDNLIREKKEIFTSVEKVKAKSIENLSFKLPV